MAESYDSKGILGKELQTLATDIAIDLNGKQPSRLVVSSDDNTAFSKISAAITAGKDVWLNTNGSYGSADYSHYVPLTEAVIINSNYNAFIFSRARPYSNEIGVIDNWKCIESSPYWELTSTFPANAATADVATLANNANLVKTLDATNGDKLQIGTGTAQNITNAGHANSAKDYDRTGSIATALNSKQNLLYFTNTDGGTTSNPAADKKYVDNSIDTWVQSNQGVWEKYRSNGVYITGGTVTYDDYLIQRLIYSSGTPNRVVALLTSDKSFLLTPVLSSGTSYTAWAENVRIMLTLINLTSSSMKITARCGGIINPSASGTAGRAYGHIAVDGKIKDTEGTPSSWASGYHNDLAIGSVVANGSRTWEVWWRKTPASTYDSFSLNIITIK